VGERSFNRTSTPSRLIFVRSPLIPPPPPPSLTTPFALNHTRRPGKWPLPSFEGCGPDFQCPQQARTHRVKPHRPLPFPEGCGLKLARWRNEVVGYTRGGPRQWEAHLVRFLHLFVPTDRPSTQCLDHHRRRLPPHHHLSTMLAPTTTHRRRLPPYAQPQQAHVPMASPGGHGEFDDGDETAVATAKTTTTATAKMTTAGSDRWKLQ
jgi:hypothetical protein